MFTFYWLYQKDDDWLAIFKTGDTFQKATDKGSLIKALSTVKYLVSYGNYGSNDKLLAKILSDGKSSFLQEYLSLDLSQEASNCTIEEIGFYLGLDVTANSPEDFCRKRIAIVEKIFEEREEYLETKFEIVKEFGLPAKSVRKTRAGLAAEILQAKKMPKRPNILFFKFDKKLPVKELPERLVGFYTELHEKYKFSMDESLAKQKFKMSLHGLTHTYGVGGVHAARNKYKGEGTFLLIDVNQFFPALIINNGFLTPAAKNPGAFTDMYQKKVDTGKQTYKVLIAATNGAMKNPYSDLYDPRMFYSVTISGQLIITHLLLILEHCIEELVQTNTDGILIKVNPKLRGLIDDLLRLWCDHFGLQVSVTEFRRVWQRDVNNYILEKVDSSLVRKGIYAEPSYASNNLPIVTAGAILALVKGIKPQKTVVKQFKAGNLSAFYYVGKIHKGFERIERQRLKSYRRMNNTICGIATSDTTCGGVYQVRDDLHSTLPGSPAHFLPANEATLKKLDTKWYVEQIEKNIF